MQRIIHIATDPGDLVLDSFAGSGTTGAVAHKLGRRWIMAEIGDHADTHIVPRLQKVIDGSDQGGISNAVNWKGGGGFRYFTLAPSLLSQDKYGNWVIASDYNPAMLAEALCKHMGFTYAPSEEDYWCHGASTETDFIYVTTQSLTHEACAKIAQDVGPDRTLLICCKAYSAAMIIPLISRTYRWLKMIARPKRTHCLYLAEIAEMTDAHEVRICRQIAQRLSLRGPQEASLQILADVLSHMDFNEACAMDALLGVIKGQYPSVIAFERDFPSLCFALATGVGKTRLMGAFISYLDLTGRSKNFFVLAPNTTIYNKLVDDFSKQSSLKYVFRGIFCTDEDALSADASGIPREQDTVVPRAAAPTD